MRDLLIITNSYDVTTDLLLDKLEGEPVFRLNFDQLSQYSMLIDRHGFSLIDPTGRCISSQSVSKAYWRKPFNAPAEEFCARANFVDAELGYALTELVNLLSLAEKLVLVEPFAQKRTGKLIQLQCADSFFDVTEYEFILNRKSPRPAGVVKSLSNELVGDGVLQRGKIELMYGSYASLEADPATVEAYRRGTSFLFVEVDDVDAALAAMKGAPLISGLHKTFYGSTEFTVSDPAGHLLTFAQLAKP